jgi:secreted trypsin-like serine protease
MTDGDSGVAGVERQEINGGTNTSNQVWPWSVRVLANGKFRCGGALIAPDWVLTVAHCLTLNPSSYSVELGSGEVIEPSSVLRHPAYVDDAAVIGHFDSGLIRLSHSAMASAEVGFIRLAVDRDDPGTTAVAIGWGMTNHNLDAPVVPKQLQQVTLPVLSNPTCNNVLPVRRFLYDDELCAGFAGGGTGVCFGDSGSPLMAQRTSGTWEHIGVPSGVTTDGHTGCKSFGIFERTTAVLDWIRNYVPDPAWSAVL